MTHFGSQNIDTFLSSLASKDPTPGGGAVAGLLSALSSSLGTMVLVYSKGKKKLEEHAALHDKCISYLETARVEALELTDADAIAYKALNAIWKLPKDDPKREANWDATVQEAITVPFRTIELCRRVLTTLQTLVGKTNAMLVSDLAIAAILAEASAKSAHWNVRINLSLLRNEEVQAEFETIAQDALTACNEIASAIDTACQV